MTDVKQSAVITVITVYTIKHNLYDHHYHRHHYHQRHYSCRRALHREELYLKAGHEL